MSVLHEDDPNRVIQIPATGRIVRNLTAEEYAASYATGTTHGQGIPETDEKAAW